MGIQGLPGKRIKRGDLLNFIPEETHAVSKITIRQKNIHGISCYPERTPLKFRFISRV